MLYINFPVIPDPIVTIDRRGYFIGETANITCSTAQIISPVNGVTLLGPNNELVTGNPSISNGKVTATFIVDNITKQSFGEYVCVIHNTAGVNTTSVRLRKRGT